MYLTEKIVCSSKRSLDNHAILSQLLVHYNSIVLYGGLFFKNSAFPFFIFVSYCTKDYSKYCKLKNEGRKLAIKFNRKYFRVQYFPTISSIFKKDSFNYQSKIFIPSAIYNPTLELGVKNREGLAFLQHFESAVAPTPVLFFVKTKLQFIPLVCSIQSMTNYACY